MRTYWTAHVLAARGHEVHVVTNAKEVRSPFRMYMREEDWRQCEPSFGTGFVKVHWTDPIDRSQSYIPMASPFVSKLASIVASVHSERPFDVIFSHYMEPYGVAGYLASQIAAVPHVVRMAGSDAGRLWRHAQFEALYDHILRSAEVVIAGGPVAERAIRRGVDPARIAFGGSYMLPEDLFAPEGPKLDFTLLRREVASDPETCDQLWGGFAGKPPYFGIYGKLGENKGSFALLDAMHRLKRAGLDVGLVALAHGRPAVQTRFRERAQQLDLVDHILQIPFLPHWRVPEFLRGCLAVCCLEQNFPIGFHTPIIPREVLLCGGCLVGSTEVIQKLPGYERLPSRYGCVTIEDVNDLEELSARLASIVRDPEPVVDMGARGRDFALELQRDPSFPQSLERILEMAVSRKPIAAAGDGSELEAGPEVRDTRFRLTHLVANTVGNKAKHRKVNGLPVLPAPNDDLTWAHEVLATVERGVVDGKASLRPLAAAVRIEIAIASAESESDNTAVRAADPLFRLRLRQWAMKDADLPALVPVRDPQLRLLEFDFDVSEFRKARTAADFPETVTPRVSYVVAFAHNGNCQREPFHIDSLTARVLELSDGTRRVVGIGRQLQRENHISEMRDVIEWVKSLFVCGLIGLQDAMGSAATPSARDFHREVH
jgi:glycosyltransferase involved in cell wall biosynthesis